MTAVAAGEIDTYRNLEPKSMLEETKQLIEAPWSKKVTDGLGTRQRGIQHSFEMQPETPSARGLIAIWSRTLRLRSCDDHRPRH